MFKTSSSLPLVFFAAVACKDGGDKSATTPDHTGRPTIPTTDHTGTVSTTPHTGTPPVTDTSLPPGLNGTPPAVAKGLPSFSNVVNRQGASVAPSALVGHPTVLWFYPAANTGG